MSAFSAWHTAKGQRVPNDCQQHSALPKTMPTDAASPCWSENWQHHELQLQPEAWPICAHAHWHSTQDSSKTCGAEGLHFSAFHMYVYWFSFQCVLPLACYNDKQFYQQTLPEAIWFTNMSVVNPRRACAARVTVLGSVCVCVCVCLSHLTYGASVRPENAVTYSAGNEGKKICGDLPETTAFKSYAAKHERKSQYANYSHLPVSAFSTWHTAKGQRVPNDCQQHSALPKTMLTKLQVCKQQQTTSYHKTLIIYFCTRTRAQLCRKKGKDTSK